MWSLHAARSAIQSWSHHHFANWHHNLLGVEKFDYGIALDGHGRECLLRNSSCITNDSSIRPWNAKGVDGLNMGISCQFGDSKETGVLKLLVSSCEVRLRFSSCSISWSCYSCKQRCDICSLHGVAMFCYVSCRPMHIQRPFPATMSETVLYQVLCFFHCRRTREMV